jgi:septal ring factor EnvC (AmiA/AmiB activator)
MSILTKIIAVIVLVLLLAAGGFDVYFGIRDHVLTGQVTSLTTANGTLKKDLSEAQQTIDKQNTSIDNANKASQDQQNQMNDLKNQLTQQQTNDAKIINQLKNQPAPKTCQDTVNYLNQEMGILQW